MDNDDKMIKENGCREEVLLFLKDELQPLKAQKSTAPYDLETEYAKTRKNKSLFVPLVMILCFLVVGLGSFIAIKQISSYDKKIKVDVNVFDDVNLRNLVDTVARAQDNYEQAVKARSSLQGDLNSGILEAKSKLNSDLFVVDSMNLSKKEASAKKAEAEHEYQNAISRLHAKFDGKITAADTEIAAYKEQLSVYDDKKVKAAEEQNKALDSERELQALERKKLEDKYENRIAELRQNIETMRKTALEDTKNAVSQVSKKYQMEVDMMQKQIDDLTATVAALKQENAVLEAENKSLTLSNQGFEADLVLFMEAASASAVVNSVSDGIIAVYIVPKARYLITPDGTPASVVAANKTIKGIISVDAGKYVFSALKEGDAAVDVSGITAGLPVKILKSK